MDLIGHRAGAFLQLTDHQGVDVFVRGSGEKLGLGGLGLNGVERRDDARALVGCENTGLLKRAGEGLRAADVGADEAAIEQQRSGKALEDLRGPAFKSASPQLHVDESPA